MATPTELASLRLAARDGDDMALAVWADKLEEEGEPDGGQALRSLLGLMEQLQGYLQELRGLRWVGPEVWGVELYDELPTQALRWSISIEVGDTDNTLRPLLAGWADFHQALEWLARRLAFPMVSLDFRPLAESPEDGDVFHEGARYTLARQHLRPLPGCVVRGVRLRHTRRDSARALGWSRSGILQ
jgi:hypothetical protein